MSETPPAQQSRLSEPLPAAARLLHIGLPKTGTTALQSTAQARREALLEHGVLYPGGGLNHREAVSALMGRRWGWMGPGAIVPPMAHWERLMDAVQRESSRRIWISHEFASEADDEMAARFASELGERIQVVVTLRPFAAILGSSWQQYLKGGTTHTFDYWLRSVLADPPKQTVTPSFHRRNDQAGVIRRWAAAAGADHVTAVVVDKARPTQLTDAFEALLDLPSGFLVDRSLGGLRANRSMSVQESELMRRVNLAIKGQGVEWSQYEALLREGGIARMLEARVPDERETMLSLPTWAAERASELGRQYAESIAASGVRVIGDLDVLAAPVAGSSERPATPKSVRLDVATEFIVGTLSAGLGRGAFFEEPSDAEPVRRLLRGVRTRALAEEVSARVRRAAARRLRLRR
nr:hypothetical protein [uncultured Friedmanniella sp.]